MPDGGDHRPGRPRSRPCRFALTALAALFVTSSTPASAAPGQSDLDVRAWQALWTDVLQRNVDDEGRIDFATLSHDHSELDRIVAFINDHDPVSAPALFPTHNARLAYYIDAYNALAMWGVIKDGIPQTLGWLKRIQFFYFQTFVIGGRVISLYDLENKVIRPMGEARVHFALNCMTVSCPRLPRTAFSSGDLDLKLESAARYFLHEPRNVMVDEKKQQILVSAIFNFYTGDFLVLAPSLIAYINRYQTDPVPDYPVQFAEYDWTVNDRSRLTRAHPPRHGR